MKLNPVLCNHEFHKPSLLVVEWVLPGQTHFTESLTLIVTSAGTKSKLSTVTLVVRALALSEWQQSARAAIFSPEWNNVFAMVIWFNVF